MRVPLRWHAAHRAHRVHKGSIIFQVFVLCCTSAVVLEPGASQLVQQDGDLTDLAENVTFACIRYVTREVLAHYAVPVGGILLVKECLYEFCDLFLRLFGVHDLVDLLFEVSLHFFAHFADFPLDSSLGSHIDVFDSII